MTYMLLLVSFILVIWVVDVLYFSAKDTNIALKRRHIRQTKNRNLL